MKKHNLLIIVAILLVASFGATSQNKNAKTLSRGEASIVLSIINANIFRGSDVSTVYPILEKLNVVVSDSARKAVELDSSEVRVVLAVMRPTIEFANAVLRIEKKLNK